MTRPSLISKDTKLDTGVERASSPADFGSWLTTDLRVKGAALDQKAEASSDAATDAGPRSIVISAAPEADAEQTAFAEWLTSDLRPRRSLAPDSLAPQVLAPDSLAPQLVPPEPPSLVAPGAVAADLDLDDLAVLPGRARRSGRSKRGRSIVALALLVLGLGGVVLFGRRFRAGDVSGADGVATSAAPALTPYSALPPPPPADELAEPEAEPEAVPARAAGGPRAAAPTDVQLDEDDPWLGPRGRNWARFEDLPSPTLSKLAREERDLAKKRDEELRRAAKRAKPAE